MRKWLSAMLMTICVISLSSCYVDITHSSLNDYIREINKHGIGYSSYELDHPKYFLPSQGFLEEYTYLEGEYYYYEEDPLRKENLPAISFLYLKYDSENYDVAKRSMLNNIQPYKNEFYSYKDYTFYVNKNFMDSFKEKYRPVVPKWFTMACYNDEAQILIFLGFIDGYPKIDGKYYSEFSSHFSTFLIEYYGSIYDFNQ